MLSKSKSYYETSLIQQFSASNNGQIYQYISSLKKQSVLPGIMSFNSITANNDIDKVELFNTQFSLHLLMSIHLQTQSIMIHLYLEPLILMNRWSSIICVPLTLLKATGIDNLNPKIYKECTLSLLLSICHLFTTCMKSAKISA